VDYNRALGDRRATAVREYLIRQGIEAERIAIVTYGEDRPAHGNAADASRRLNRRGALVVRAMTTMEKQ
jgi:peptidoglycan-associated lipoprotein